MFALILGLALFVLILVIVLVAFQRKDINEVFVEVKNPWRFTINIKMDKPNNEK